MCSRSSSLAPPGSVNSVWIVIPSNNNDSVLRKFIKWGWAADPPKSDSLQPKPLRSRTELRSRMLAGLMSEHIHNRV